MLASGGPSGSRFLKKAPQKLLISWRFFLKATALVSLPVDLGEPPEALLRVSLGFGVIFI